MKIKSIITILLILFMTEVLAQEYLALGDSYTIGESVTVNDCWPNQLVKAIKGSRLEVNSARIIAKTGWTTTELIEGINNQQINGQYDLVSLLIGVNNQYRGQSIEVFEKDLNELIQTAISFSKKGAEGVFLVSIPDWGVTPFAKDRDQNQIAKEIEAFNTVVSRQAKSFGVLFVDITPISIRAKEDRSLLAEDQLHPSGKMYGLWVEKIKQTLLKLQE